MREIEQKEHILLCDLTHMGQKIASDSFPYGIGCIAAYIEVNSQGLLKTHLCKFPHEVFDTFIKYRPKIVGFSNYVWNLDLGRSMAQAIKEEFPETIIVFGGPNFPSERKEQEAFLRSIKVIDFYIEGEGEKAFYALVQNLRVHNFDMDKVKPLSNPSVRTLHKDVFVTNGLAERVKSLEEVPSPYLAGMMDKFFGEKLMPLIQTTRGCPFTCAYCVEGSNYYREITKGNPLERTAAEVEYIGKRAVHNKQLFIADSNFGMYETDLETARVIRQVMDKWGYPSYIHVATGKNRKDLVLELARILQGKMRLSGSVQSLDPTVLSNIKRKNIAATQLLDLAVDAAKVGANSYSEVILGLPGDSLKAHMETMRQVIEAGFNYALPWTLMLLKGSELDRKDVQEKFGLVVKYRVLPRCFGTYNFGGKKFVSAEIEEVCVGGINLPFEDYLECRIFTLTTALFYNDKFFEEILEPLKALRISPFIWLQAIHKLRDTFSENLTKIYEGFKRDTRDELWDSSEELRNFVEKPSVVEKFISGELGKNVMYHYRTMAFISCMEEINDIAFRCTRSLIAQNHSSEYKMDEDYFEQLRLFSFARKSGFFDLEKVFELEFTYNFKKIMDEGLWNKHIEKDDKKHRYRFYHSPEPKRFIKEQMNLFGSDIVGLAKVMSRINIKNMYRRIEEL